MSTSPGFTLDAIWAVVSVPEPNALAAPKPAMASAATATADPPAISSRRRRGRRLSSGLPNAP